MRRALTMAFATVLIISVSASLTNAQFVVYDPTNYAQALARYAQLLQQYQFWVRQARRIPIDMATRYLVPTVRWRTHDLETSYAFARSILTALNYGDANGTLYNEGVDRLDTLADLLENVPASLRRRLSTTYGTIELADSVANMGIHQVGALRFNGRSVLAAIQNMDDDASAASDSFNTQIAVLNKINGANVLGLRIGEGSNQFLMHILEQLLVQNKRSRDAEAQAMDAHLFQWRFGSNYGRDLYSRTAVDLDTWRQP
jgi:hypothetical protein